MKLDITDVHFIELHKRGYSLDMVILLEWLHKGLSVEHIINDSKKIEAIYKTMVRKELIVNDGTLTKLGNEILVFINNKTNKTFLKPKIKDSVFDEWWNIFPSNDKFIIKGKSFGPTRSFKTDKDTCRLLFNKMVLEELFTAEQIIKATKYDITLKMERSFKTGSNQLKYLRNSATYLRQKDFQGFIGMKESELSINNNNNLGSVDI